MRVSVAQRAYIAGFLEGEGSFYINSQVCERQTIPDRHQLRSMISVSQKSRRPLDLIKKRYGGTIRHRRQSDGRSCWHYYLTASAGIIKLTRDIYPFLMAPRARYRAACIHNLAVLKRKSGVNGRTPLPQENQDRREAVYELWSKSRR